MERKRSLFIGSLKRVQDYITYLESVSNLCCNYTVLLIQANWKFRVGCFLIFHSAFVFCYVILLTDIYAIASITMRIVSYGNNNKVVLIF